MNWDGVLRPSQALSYTDPLGTLTPLDRLRKKQSLKETIEGKEAIQAIGEERDATHGESRQKKKQHSESEDANLSTHKVPDSLEKAFLKAFHIELNPDHAYRLDVNEAEDAVVLWDSTADEILIEVPMAKFIQLARDAQALQGLFSDRSA